MLVLIAGAGVIGLAAGAALARRGAEVVVAEAGAAIGTGISSRNSEVVHGGMYYPTSSLKAQLCVEGRRRLMAYASARGIRVAVPGKLIVATAQAEIVRLEAIQALGRANGVEGLVMLDGAGVRAREPALSCLAALWSPHTGIIDSHALMLALQGEIEDAGGSLAFMAPMRDARPTRAGWAVRFGRDEDGDGSTLTFDAIVNAAGLTAPALARRIEGLPPAAVPRQLLAKGHYFAYAGAAVFKTLVYPAPVDGGLGVHVTLDLAGRMRFGPDVEWVEHESYDVDPGRAQAFERAIRRYWPGLPDGRLVPDYAGIRPKLSGPGEPPADFVISGPGDHGLAGLVCLFGIESPGLTASLAIGERVADMVMA